MEASNKLSNNKNASSGDYWGITQQGVDCLLEQSSNFVAICGKSHLTNFNTRLQEELGYTKEELLNLPYNAFVHEDSIATLAQIIQAVEFETHFKRKDGSYFSVQWISLGKRSSQASCPENKEFLQVCIGKDLPTPKEIVSLESNTKSNFLSNISHELRTPLTGLLGMIDLMEDDSELTDELKEYVSVAKRCGQSLLAVINNLMDAARLEADNFTLESVSFNPTTIAQEVIKVFNDTAEKKKLSLRVAVSPSIPLDVLGDPCRFRQILHNLVENAIKFTREGSVTVTIDGEIDYSSTECRRFIINGSVNDTGAGIPSSNIPTLFQPFSQEYWLPQQRIGGSGLGLYITRRLCELMNGSVTVASEPDKGSIFNFKVCFDLPKPVEKPEATGHEVPALPNLRVLVAEDNPVIRALLIKNLSNEGCNVDIAFNGQEAVQAITQQRYDVVLMDFEMPIMDGIKATNLIRSQYPKDELPIIGITAQDGRARFINSGMNGYITKPFRASELKTEILKCIDRS